MSKFFLVKQSSYKNKDGKAGLLTLLVDEKGNAITTTSVGVLDPKIFPILPEVEVQIEAGSAFNGRISSRIVGINVVGLPQ
ncbi:MAG: hypothetical protein E6R13_10275 [Spirochaetes bacterium]|nr:MAG: hypothetical protein E6R13_10275 [Spirochaetota bacterium]